MPSSVTQKPAVQATDLPSRKGSSYPAPFHLIAGEREKWPLGDHFGLQSFGVNLVRLPPGAGSSQRHWHTHEDEMVYVLTGELDLVTNAGTQRLTAGMVVGFPANSGDGHHFLNKGSTAAVYLEIGARLEQDRAHYPDIDLFYDGEKFFHKNGTPY